MAPNRDIRWHPVNAGSLDLHGWNVAIVGGTGGLGRAVARVLASRGASVLVVGQTFRDADVPGITFLAADLSLMSEARRVAAALPAETLDLVLLTTGIFAAPVRQETPEGLERDMAVSYLSRLAILRGIGPRLGANRPATRPKPRVFVMGYPGTGQAGDLEDLNAEKSYSGMKVHMSTVAGNEALVLDAAKRYPNATFFGLNPGLVKTNIRSNFLGEGTVRFRVVEWLIGLFNPTPEAYAERMAPLLVSPDLEAHTGAMFDKKAQAILPSPQLTDERVAALIAASESLVERAVGGEPAR
jgi:NAD(P)-dependent dehydrogenase (short-subunit alcohol dehydrogenase family)